MNLVDGFIRVKKYRRCIRVYAAPSTVLASLSTEVVFASLMKLYDREIFLDYVTEAQVLQELPEEELGTAFTQGHANLLKRFTKEVYCTFDSDGAGIKAALRAIPILKEAGITVKIVKMDPYKDPDELIKAKGAEAYEERIAQAQNSFLFEIEVLEQQYNLKDPESKTKFYNDVAGKILEFEEELERENYIEAVAQKYQTEY